MISEPAETPPRPVVAPPAEEKASLKMTKIVRYYLVLIPLQRIRQHLFGSLLCLAILVFIVTMLQANLFAPNYYFNRVASLSRLKHRVVAGVIKNHHKFDKNGRVDNFAAASSSAEIVQIDEIEIDETPDQQEPAKLEINNAKTFAESLPDNEKTSKQKLNNNATHWPFKFDDRRMEKLFTDRQDQATRTCLKYYNYGPNISFIPYREVSYRFIYVDDVHKILYCAVPKAASTNWKRMFMLLGSNGNKTVINMAMNEVHEGNATWPYIKPLKSYTPLEVAARIQNYTKIMWVRNPLHRLVSAWRSKFTKNNTFYNEVYGSYIIKKYRPRASEAEIKAGFPVALKEFFLYLRDEGLVRGDVHWGHYHTHCLSCIIPYDYIGKLEDMSYEATYVLRKVTGDRNFQFPLMSERKSGAAPSMTDSDYMAAIKELPIDLLQYVALEFKIDYEMFGYPMPRFFD